MKKIIFLITFLILSSIGYATCDTYQMNIVEVQKTNDCYSFFSATFQDPGCLSGCFKDVNRFILKQGNTTFTNNTGITTTYFGVSIRSPICTEKIVTMQMILNDGQICEKTINLDEALLAWQKYNNEQVNQTITQTTSSGSSSSKKIQNTTTNIQNITPIQTSKTSVQTTPIETVKTVEPNITIEEKKEEIAPVQVVQTVETKQEIKESSKDNSKIIDVLVILIILFGLIATALIFIFTKQTKPKKRR